MTGWFHRYMCASDSGFVSMFFLQQNRQCTVVLLSRVEWQVISPQRSQIDAVVYTLGIWGPPNVLPVRFAFNVDGQIWMELRWGDVDEQWHVVILGLMHFCTIWKICCKQSERTKAMWICSDAAATKVPVEQVICFVGRRQKIRPRPLHQVPGCA